MSEPMLGLHVSIGGSLDSAFDRAAEVGCTTFQIFTRNPRGWKFKSLTNDQVAAFLDRRKRSGLERIVDHMPYLPNLASPDRGMMKASRKTLDAELRRCDALGIDYLVAHIGSHMGKGTMVGVRNVAGAFNEAIAGSQGGTTLLLENMAGQKNCVGARFEELKQILDQIKESERAAVCFDTCMPPNSLVLCEGSTKRIQNVSPGDQIIDSQGAPSIVTRSLCRSYLGDLIWVRPAGLPWICATPEHPLLCVKVNRVRYLEEHPWRVKLTDAPAWVNADQVKVGQFLVMPKLLGGASALVDFQPYFKSHARRPFSLKMPLSLELAEFLGLYLAEGFTFMGEGRGVRGGDNGKVYFSYGKHEKQLINRTIILFDRIFGLEAWVDEGETTIKVCAGSNVLARFLRANFGPNAREKGIPSFIIRSPGEIVREFVLSYLAGDGCVDAQGIRFVTASEMVANQLVLLLARIDIRATISCHRPTEGNIAGRIIHGNGWYDVKVGRGDSRKLGFEYRLPSSQPRTILRTSSSFLIPIAAIRRGFYNGYVYNLTTETGSFMAPLVATHNCHAFASGFDLASPAAVNSTMALFDEIVGFELLKVVHLNDSKGLLGSNLDRHESIGEGAIGERGFRSFLHYEEMAERPIILETPYSDLRTMKKSLATVRRLLK